MSEQKGVPVSLRLQTEIFQEGQKDEYFFDVMGQFVKVGSNLYLRYEEPIDEKRGQSEKVSVTIKIEPNGSIQLFRADQQRMRLRFTYQQENASNYQTPYGMLKVVTKTNNLRVSLKDKPVSGNVEIDYELLVEGAPIGVYHLRLEFTA